MILLQKNLIRQNLYLTKFYNNPFPHEDYPPQIYFKDFNSSSLDLIVFYWFYSNDYWAYMNFADKVNSDILKNLMRQK